MVNTFPKKLRSIFVLVCNRNICLCTFHRRLREGNLNNLIDPEPTDCVKLVAFLTLRLGAVNFTKPRFPNLWAVPNNIHTAASPLFSELEIIYPRTYKLLKLLLLV